MTACKDSLNGKKAVSATLAGVLAVGMVPAAAFAADQPADEAEGQGIELQATDAETYAAGTINEVTYYDNSGDVIDTTDGSVTYTLGSDVKSIAITSITPQVAGAKAVSFEAKDWTVTYAKAVAGTDKDKLTYTEDLPTTAGTWYMKSVCKATGDDNKAASGATIYTEVKVVANALEGSTVKFAYTENSKTVYKDTLTFENADVKSHLKFYAPDGTTELVNGTNCSIKYYKVGGDEALTSIVTAGDYVAEITGTDKYAGQRASVKFTVSPLDLSSASIVIPDTTATSFDAAIADMTINGEKVTSAIKGLLTVKMDTTDKYSYSDNGKYTVTVSADANAKDVQSLAADKTTPAGNKATESITGTATADFYKVADTAVFTYGKTALNGTGVTETQSIDVDLSVKKPAYFDIEKVAATLTKGGTVDPDDISVVSVTNKETGAAATEADLKTAGTWVVTLGVDRGSDFAQGGTAQLIVKVTNGKVKGADVFVSVAGENVPGNNSGKAAKDLEYTGENLLDSIDVVVKYKGKELAQGTDYTVKVTNAKGDDVDEIVNVADGYKVTVESDTYDLTEAAATEFYFDVTPVAISGAYDKDHAAKGQIRVKGLDLRGFAPYTGEEITPAIEYIAKIDKDGKPVWKDLPAEQYKLTAKNSKDKASDIVDADTYTLTVKDVKDTEATKNYTVTTTELTLKVSKDRVFKDVPNGEWFTDSIYKLAQDPAYAVNKVAVMSGYNGGDFFGPYNELTRAETATVIGRLAGVNVAPDDQFTNNSGFTTPFSDVAQGAWYANAVAWASKAGVVTGFGDGTFGPDQSITREQFALMLQRYADKCGLYKASDGKALAAMPDASGVSDWAKDAVAWAVEQGFIGKGGTVDAQGTITRGMAATIVARFMDAYDLTTEVADTPADGEDGGDITL